MIIELNKVEQKICELVANERFSYKQENQVESLMRCELTDIEATKRSFGAELIMAKLLNVSLNFELYQGGDTEDLKYNNSTIEIKTTIHTSGHLIFPIYGNGRPVKVSDINFLVIEKYPEYTLMEDHCWATRDEVLNSEIKDFGYGPNHALPQYKLHSLKEL